MPREVKQRGVRMPKRTGTQDGKGSLLDVYVRSRVLGVEAAFSFTKYVFSPRTIAHASINTIPIIWNDYNFCLNIK